MLAKPSPLIKVDVDPKHCKLSGALRCTSNFSPTCGCTVVTKEVMREGIIAIRTFQIANGMRPVMVMCGDRESHNFFINLKLANVEPIYKEAKKPDNIKDHNTYHRNDAIVLKMEIFSLAVIKYGDAVFFDSDLIFLHRLVGPADCEVALSMNLPAFVPQSQHMQQFGIFNAGLVWTCNQAFPAWWKHQYFHPEAQFYEQSGMNYAPAAFRCGYFDLNHNYGFWRGPVDKRQPMSLHIHLDTQLDSRMIVAEKWSMLDEVRKARREVWKILNATKHRETGALCRHALNHPKKVMFCHYGKAAGVYVDTVMHQQIIPDYMRLNSWVSDMKRDWTQEELHKHIREIPTGTYAYLHQHHVNITEEDVILANDNGWHTFMFVKPPVDTICALYYWDKRLFASTGEGIVFPSDNPRSTWDLCRFWMELLKEENRYLWALPKWWMRVKDVAPYSNESFDAFLIKRFGVTHKPAERMNTSSNPGFDTLRNEGAITQEMMDALIATPEYREYSRMFDHGSL